MQTRCRVEFQIFDFPESPDELTQKLGMAPSRVSVPGDRAPLVPHRRLKVSRWILEAPNHDAPLQDQLHELLDLLWPLADRINDLPVGERVIECVVHDVDRSVPLTFDNDDIARIARLDAHFDITYYNVDSDDPRLNQA